MKQTLYRKTSSEREVIRETLRRMVEDEPSLQFAYAYGSFLEDRPFHDIDLAVYLAVEGADSTGFGLGLGLRLEEALHGAGQRAPVDVRVLNQAPLGFRYQVFRGHLLFSRNEALRVGEVVRAVSHYLDLKPLQEPALKEAMAL